MTEYLLKYILRISGFIEELGELSSFATTGSSAKNNNVVLGYFIHYTCFFSYNRQCKSCFFNFGVSVQQHKLFLDSNIKISIRWYHFFDAFAWLNKAAKRPGRLCLTWIITAFCFLVYIICGAKLISIHRGFRWTGLRWTPLIFRLQPMKCFPR